MSDLIDRQTAIDALRQLQKNISGDYTELDPMVMAGCGYIGDCIGELECLPSAQPEISCSETPNTSDTISRQAAIDDLISRQQAISRAVEFRMFDRPVKMVAVSELEALPSAQPERSLWFRIGEFCVGESKGDISAEMAIKKIRALLRAERRTDD